MRFHGGSLLTVILGMTTWSRPCQAHPNHQLDLVATKPAVELAEDAFPVGNGFMGALILGGIASDTLVLSEHSLWDDLEVGSPPLAQDLAKWRPQQALATLRVETGHVAGRTRTFMRRLDLQTGTVEVTYRHDRVRHQREYFCSKPDGVLAARFRANRQGEVNLAFLIDSAHTLKSQFDEEAGRLVFSGVLERNGLAFALGLELRCKGGEMRREDSRLRVQGADEATLFLAMGSAFGSGGEGPAVASRLDALEAKDVLTVRQAHLPDFQELFHSMYITLEGPSQTDWTTEKRLEAYRSEPSHDPGLEELLFQYARYLMIASSREGSLPAHRRGRWVFPPREGVDNAYDPNWMLAYAGVRPTQLGDCRQPLEVWAGERAESPRTSEEESTSFHRMRRAAVQGDGESAHALLRTALQEQSLPNLLPRNQEIGAHMLLIEALSVLLARVDDGVLTLVPALPAAWPDGSFVGLRPGTGKPLYEVAAAWQEGTLLEAYLTHREGGRARLRLDPEAYEVLREGASVPLEREGEGVSFAMDRGEMVVIQRRSEP